MSKAKSVTAMNKDAKAVIHLAFDDLGGVERLVDWANNPANLGTFYSQIWSKIIPKDVKAEVGGPNGGPMKLVIEWKKPE